MQIMSRLRAFSRRRRSETRTRRLSAVLFVERALLAVAVIYVALQVYPQVLFAHSFSQEGITIYSRAALPEEVADRAVEIAGLLRRSELSVSGFDDRVFICNHPGLFRLFSPIHGRSFAVSVPLTDNVFVADADLAANTAKSRRAEFNQRSFSSVVAHEIAHRLIRDRVGVFRSLTLETWIREGYSDYIAGESSFPEPTGLEILAAGRSEPSKSFQYFLWRQMVAHLVERRGLAFDELVAMGGEADRVEAETRAALRDQPGNRPD